MDAYFAGGCFWCMETPFSTHPGVRDVIAGYAGGAEADPTYEAVKRQETGHRETVRVIYDENVTSFAALLDIYLDAIDPFDGEGQFIDRGHSYTCAVFCRTAAEEEWTRLRLRALEKSAEQKVCVDVEAFSGFWVAEDEHLHYAERHPDEYQKEYVLSGRAGRRAGEAGKKDVGADLADTLRALLDPALPTVSNLANACAVIAGIGNLNWCGFYIADGETLYLGPFQGEPACTVIPFGRGVCGTAAAKKETIRVEDVRLFPGHIACSEKSRSEIVVPLLKGDVCVGVLDLDAPVLGRFDENIQVILESAAKVIESIF